MGVGMSVHMDVGIGVHMQVCVVYTVVSMVEDVGDDETLGEDMHLDMGVYVVAGMDAHTWLNASVHAWM